MSRPSSECTIAGQAPAADAGAAGDGLPEAAQIDVIAESMLASYDRAGWRLPFSGLPQQYGRAGLDQSLAYRVAARIVALRQARGERLLGRKLGFTNRSIWPVYGVDGPLVGAVWDRTLVQLSAHEATVSASHLIEPRLEPEIVLGLARAPRSNDPDEVAAALDWVAHGFELVQSPFPNWRFSAADAIIACGLHGRLIVGPRVAARQFGDPESLIDALTGLRISLSRDQQLIAEGIGSVVLDGPVQALAYAMKIVDASAAFPPLAAGDLVTTGTLTDAQPIGPGQTWRSVIAGVPLPGLTLRITY